ncbi:adenylyl cyclase X E-like isoform X2 [Drosophila bipectinata]|uniref:adenylyl cyclase X E-like isoform X2 n=1 Tax=Drosophila bipectinata TaxID=42026 RepID=UPI0038B33B74
MHSQIRSSSALNIALDASRCTLNYAREHMWDPLYLKQRVEELGLTKEFDSYQIRLWRSYLSIFFVLHILVTVGHCALLLVFAEVKQMVYLDICVYSGCAILLLSILSINFCEKFVARHNWVMSFTSVLAALILLAADIITAIYHYYANTDLVVASFYDVYIVFVIYMYLPILSVRRVLVLGTVASLVYMVHFVVFMTPVLQQKVSSITTNGSYIINATHYVCLNLMGIFYRITTNMMVRSSFLDRHQYVTEELMLRNARRHEKVLVDSILPPLISKSLQSEIRNKITLVQQGTKTVTSLQRSMAVQIHPEVSILYADVVNYTQLTTTINVETLVIILHDLYGRFDMAAATFRAERIKFLGDCYYCVAGITEVDPDHAQNCVDLGFAMISNIQEVRGIYDLDISMRIGVHSGLIFSGVLGEAKLQFDIWGTDANIANVLESTGLPGCVHISNRTLSYIEEEPYEIEPGPSWAAEHPLLVKHKVETYILRMKNLSSTDFKNGHNVRMFSLVRFKSPINATRDESSELVFQEELRQEYKKMPVFRWNFGSLRRGCQPSDMPNLSNLCLTYKDKEMEKLYINQRDYIFKYSMLLAYLIGCLLVILQFDSNTSRCILCTIVNYLIIIFFGILTFIAWYKKMCWTRNQIKPKRNRVYNRFSCFLFYLINKIQENLEIRVGLYIFITLSHGTIIALILILCDQNRFILDEIEHKIFHYEAPNDACFHPWVITNMMSIFICMVFTFTRIPLKLKTLVAFLLSGAYLLLVNLHLRIVFHHSFTSTPSLPAEYAHTMQILVTILTVYQKERMTTFASKVNFKWRQELKRKQSDAVLTNQSITIILHNILPAHVINVYLTSLAKHELYYENYQMVSVMFAMLMNFQMDLRNLRLLNDIITEFDILLLYYKEFYVVEKIKVVGCTYMAACGLDLNFAGAVSIKSRSSNVHASPHLAKLLALPLARNHDGSDSDELDEVVFVLASFALDMMRTLSKCLESQGQEHGSITIGLSSGEVMAGIVGASQPHYDIWGNAVNMASRMQTTGLPDNIQVTEESAHILQDYGIKCNFRGLTFVKGRGEIPTYLVGIDPHYCFIDKEASRNPSHVLRSTQISYGSAYSKPEDTIGTDSDQL